MFANNATYSRSGAAARWPGPVKGGILAGNVAFGQIVGGEGGFVRGAGLRDFLDIAWDASRRDARPSAGGKLIREADREHATSRDLNGTERKPHAVPGAYQPPR